MALNVKGLRGRREAAADRAKERGGSNNDLYKFDFGTTAIYIPPPMESMNGYPFIEYQTHHNLQGNNQGSAVCLGAGNEGLWSEATIDQVEVRVEAEKLTLPAVKEGCNGCEAYEGRLPKITANIPGERLKKMFGKDTYVWPIVPWGMVANSALVPFESKECRLTLMGPQLWDALAAQIELNGDVTDPTKAILLLVVKTKTGPKVWNVEYTAAVWPDSIRTPLRIPKPVKASIRERMVAGGDCDPHRLIANFTKDNDQIMVMLGGDSIKEVAGKGESGEPACFGSKAEIDPTDEDCIACAFKIKCGEKTGVDMSGDTADSAPEPTVKPEPVRARKPNAERSAAEADALLGGDDEDDDDDDIPDDWPAADEADENDEGYGDDDDGGDDDLEALEKELAERKAKKKKASA